MNKQFWQTLGRRRTRNLMIVATVNAIFAAALILWLLPQKDESKLLFDQTEQRKMDLQTQIVELPKKYEQMQKNEAAYEALQMRGIFAPQDRIAFRQILDDLRVKTGVRQVAYDIQPLTVINNQALANTDKQLVKTQVSVSLLGATDLEMREFLHALQQAVPGLSTITAQRFERAEPLTSDNLVKFGNGNAIDFVKSNYSFDWYNLQDKPDPLGMQQGQQGAPQNPVVPSAAASLSPAAIPAVPTPAAPVAGGTP